MANFGHSVRRRLELLRQLHGLVDQQERLIDTGELDRLLEVLALKQQLLNELEALEHKLAADRKQLAQGGNAPTAGLPGELQSIWAEGQALVKRLLEREAACEARMQARRAEVSAALGQLGRAHQAHEAYRSASRAEISSTHLISEA